MKLQLYTILLILFGIVNGIEITLHGFIYANTTFHEKLEEKTNEYMKSKGLDITLKVSLENPTSSSSDPHHIANFIEQSLSRKERASDLYITDTVYTARFSQYFEDLNNYVDKNVIKLYKDGAATKTCIVDKKLIGLPLTVDYGGLYANLSLLEKYNKSLPETWDELVETTNYIYEKESPTNPELRKYLGDFSDSENGMVSIIEFIHSFRNSPTDNFPDYTSDEAILALEKMKYVKENGSLPEDFCADDTEVMKSFMKGNFVFFRYWYFGEGFPNLSYKLIFNHLPGNKKGVTASCIGGSNISMNKFISEERKKAAGEILSFLHSYEHQKYGIITSNIRSAIHSTYSDPEICKNIDCPLFSTLQSIVRPNSFSVNYEEYSEKLRTLIKSYINGETDMTAKEVLTKIDDIKRIHFIEINSITGIAIMAITILTFILLLISYVYISTKRFKSQFSFLPYHYWSIIIIGILMIAGYSFTGIDVITSYKCLIRPFLLSVGFDLIYMPLFLKLISIFQSNHGISVFVKNHFTVAFIFSIIIDILLNMGWYLSDPLVVNKLMVPSGQNFQYCDSSSNIGSIFKYVMIGLKLLILSIMSFLVFVEWNLVAFKSDIRSITSTIYTNILIIGLFVVVGKINIKNRYLFFGLRDALVLIFCLSTLFIIIGSKFYHISLKKEKLYPDITSFSHTYNSSSNNASRTYNNTFSKSQLSQTKHTILNYHYQTGTTIEKPYPALFTSTINSNYNGNLFKDTYSNDSSNTQSQTSETLINNSNNKSVTNNSNINNSRNSFTQRYNNNFNNYNNNTNNDYDKFYNRYNF